MIIAGKSLKALSDGRLLNVYKHYGKRYRHQCESEALRLIKKEMVTRGNLKVSWNNLEIKSTQELEMMPKKDLQLYRQKAIKAWRNNQSSKVLTSLLSTIKEIVKK